MEDVTIVELPPQQVLGTRRRGAYSRIGVMLGELAQFAVQNGVQLAGPPVFVIHESSKEEMTRADREQNADIEVAFPIAGQPKESGDIRSYELPGGTMARIVHKGPYEECEPAYDRLFAWVQDNGKRVVGPLREVYLNDPREVAPQDILTEIYVPIA